MSAVGVGEIAQHSLAECLVFRVEFFRPDVLEQDHRAGAVVGGCVAVVDSGSVTPVTTRSTATVGRSEGVSEPFERVE